MNAIIQLFPDNPPPEPPTFARFRQQREREDQHAALHMEARNRYGMVIPIIVPFYWTQADIVDCALGIQRKPAYVATVTRVSNVREKRNARLAGQLGVAA